MKIISIITILLSLNLFIQLSDNASAEQERVWECYPNSCSVPNKRSSNAKSYELEDSRKFEIRAEKIMAKEPKQFKRYGKENNRELGLDKNRRGNFGVWSFPVGN